MFDFKTDEFVVYPAHGVGKITSIETQEVANIKLEMFVVFFEKDKLTLKVPTQKAVEVGMRPLSSKEVIEKAIGTLKGKARVKRAMWSRRAKEYEDKIDANKVRRQKQRREKRFLKRKKQAQPFVRKWKTVFMRRINN